ncbi:SH3 domain-containing protein [Nesterenkonia aerolata]|uniref:SH3 domain-containing protein n=1 Tax=Nesterenkonia aerolata TaxID=3074079 RepID=A0ABU2DRD5_9MICC|nr:SH3 domain-containing protein [Nesterenkonia sp. LY-0111]MDR8019063.1 SH3 domain-containing protein [Nesterenkonia sp. LY-0111]
MPKKLSAAVVGTLIVGLSLPLNAPAATAAVVQAAPSSVALPGGAQAGLAPMVAPATTFHDPLPAGVYRYTSEHGARCIPIRGSSTTHPGQDLGASEGTPIRAIAAGKVVRTFSGTASQAGYVVIEHSINGRTMHSAYVHMWNANSHVRIGQTVRGGQTIALVGNSGPSTAPHLHLEIWDGAWLRGTSVKPTTWLAARGVDLKGKAASVLNITRPSTCSYYAFNATSLYSQANTTSPVLAQLAAGTPMVGFPGAMTNSMVQVRAGGLLGWVPHLSVTPSRPNGYPGRVTPVAPTTTTSASGTYRATTQLNARSGPGTSHGVVTTLRSGQQIAVTGRSSNGWFRFTSGGRTVWASGAYLEAVVSNVTSASGTYEATGRVNIRTGPGTSHARVGQLNRGETVRVTGRSGNWFRATRNGSTVWIHANYLRVAVANVVSVSGTYEATGRVNIRTGPGTSHARVGSLSRGDRITVTGRSGSWLRGTRNGQTVWVSGSYVRAVVADVARAGGTYEATGRVNIRTGPGTGHARVGSLSRGDRVTVTGRSGSWFRATRNGRTVWIHGNYLRAAVANVASASGTYEATGRVNIRTGPGTSHARVGSLSRGDRVTVTGRSGTWYRATYQGSTVWISGSYLRQAAAERTAGTTTWVNMRAGAGMSHAVSQTVAPQTVVRIISGPQQGWYRVSVNGRTGRIYGTYLNFQAGGQVMHHEMENLEPTELVARRDTVLRAERRESAEMIDRIAAGETMIATSLVEGWYFVSFDGAGGWVRVEDVEAAPERDEADLTEEAAEQSVEEAVDQAADEGADEAVDDAVEEVEEAADEAEPERPGVAIDAMPDEDLMQEVPAEDDDEEPVEESSPSPSPMEEETEESSEELIDEPAEDVTSEPVSESTPEGAESESAEPDEAAPEDEAAEELSDEPSTEESSTEEPADDSSPEDSAEDGADDSAEDGVEDGSEDSADDSTEDSAEREDEPEAPVRAASSFPLRTDPGGITYRTVWDELARCESDGDWSAAPVEGRSGGLGLTQQDWQRVGGTGAPHEASRHEQIARAYALWQLEGWEPWNSCIDEFGVTGDPGGIQGYDPDEEAADEDEAEESEDSTETGADTGEEPGEAASDPALTPTPDAAGDDS